MKSFYSITLDQLFNDIDNSFGSIQQVAAQIKQDKNILESVVYGSAHNLYQLAILRLIDECGRFYSKHKESNPKQVFDLVAECDTILEEPKENIDRDEKYAYQYYTAQLLINYCFIWYIASNKDANHIYVKKVISNLKNWFTKDGFKHSGDNLLLLRNLVQIYLVMLGVLERELEVDTQNEKYELISEVTGLLVSLIQRIDSFADSTLRSTNSLLQDASSGRRDLYNQVLEEVTSMREIMRPGQAADPLLLLGSVLLNVHNLHSQDEISLDLKEKYKKLYDICSQIFFKKVKEKGVEYYENNQIYQDVLYKYYRKKLSEVLDLNITGIEKDKLYVSLLEEYIEMGAQKNAQTFDLFVSKYFFDGKKESIEDFYHIVKKEDVNINLLRHLVYALLLNNELQVLLKLLNRSTFAFFKEDDNILIAYLYAQIVLNNKEQGSKFQETKITEEDRVRLLSIEERTRSSFVEPVNKIIGHDILVYVLTMLKQKEVATSAIWTIFFNKSKLILGHLEYLLFSMLSNFEQVFLYDDNGNVDREANHSLMTYYLYFTPHIRDISNKIKCLKKLSKLCLLEGLYSEAFRTIQTLAEIDDSYKEYISYINSNPKLSDEEKIGKLSEYPDLLTEEELEFIITPIIKKQNDSFIFEAIRLSSSPKVSKVESKKVEVIEPIVAMRDKRFKLAECHNFADNGISYYVYCEPSTWGNITDKKVEERFKTQLTTELGFAKASGQNGIKQLSHNVFEIKINDDKRILGFKVSAKIEADINSESSKLNLLYFYEYVDKAHDTQVFKLKLERVQAQADECGKFLSPK